MYTHIPTRIYQSSETVKIEILKMGCTTFTTMVRQYLRTLIGGRLSRGELNEPHVDPSLGPFNHAGILNVYVPPTSESECIRVRVSWVTVDYLVICW